MYSNLLLNSWIILRPSSTSLHKFFLEFSYNFRIPSFEFILQVTAT